MYVCMYTYFTHHSSLTSSLPLPLPCDGKLGLSSQSVHTVIDIALPVPTHVGAFMIKVGSSGTLLHNYTGQTRSTGPDSTVDSVYLRIACILALCRRSVNALLSEGC